MILVTEHNAEVNAGFVVLRGSNHAPPLLEADWQSIPLGPGDMQDLAISAEVGVGLLPACVHNGPRMRGMTGT